MANTRPQTAPEKKDKQVTVKTIAIANSKYQSLQRRLKKSGLWRWLCFFFGSWIYVLLPFVPAGFAVNYSKGRSATNFAVNFIAIFPLSTLAGQSLEPIRARWQRLATFTYISVWNFVQLISGIFLLRGNQVLVLQTSLVGGILSNLLLMLGICLVVAGGRRVSSSYNFTVAHVSANLLSLASTSLLIPTAATLLKQTSPENVIKQSRGAAVILILVYLAYIFFAEKTHASVFQERGERTPARSGSEHGNDDEDSDEDADEVPKSNSFVLSGAVLLALSTTLAAFNSEFMVDSIQVLVEHEHVTATFIGLILLPLLNNDLGPIAHAMNDRMDETMAYTIGKSIQTALLITPLFVLISWGMDIQPMTLNFNGFEIVSLFASVLLLNYLIIDGRSTWIQGVLLMADWGLIAIAAYFAD